MLIKNIFKINNLCSISTQNINLLKVKNLRLFHSKISKSNLNAKKTSIFQKFFYYAGGALGGLILYDGIANDFIYTMAAHRFMKSLETGIIISIDYILVLRNEDDEHFSELLSECHRNSAERILKTCLENGGLYIKVGQGVAAVNHILPKEYIKTLSKLQNECLPSGRDDVTQVFLDEFNMKPNEMFLEFDYEAVAAASLCQVFKAKTIEGEDVAVKVQYKDLLRRFPSDLGTIIFLQDIAEIFFKDYNFGWIFRNLRKNLEKEMDFIQEAKNAEKCAKDLKMFKFLYIPKINWKYTSQRVLTMEWVDGFKVTDAKQIKSNNIDLKKIDSNLFSMFSEQIFSTGWIHADPHPGNILLRPNKAQSGNADIILLDHGLYETLPQNIRLKLCEFWEATVLRNEKRMKVVCESLKIKEYKCFAEILFQMPYDKPKKTFTTKLTDEDIKYLQNEAKNNFGKIMKTLKEMPRNMIFVVRNLNTVRAIGKEHGDTVDRPKLMARYAQRCLYKNSYSIIGFIKWFYRRVQFEYCLFKSNLQMSMSLFYVNLLYKLGRSTRDAETLIKDIEENLEED